MKPLQASLLLTALVVPAPTGCVVVADDDAGGSAEGTSSASGTQTGSSASEGTASASASASASDSSDASTSAGSTSTSASGGSTGVSSTTDPTGTGTDGGSTTGDSGGEQGGGTIDVTLTGCTVDFGGTVVVSYNGSLGVASVYDNGATLTGSLQFDLEGTGAIQLSSQHRVDTGIVVNMVEIGQGTWTNLDSDALSGGVDRIGGTLTVNAWDPASGVSDLEFDGVSLLNLGNGNVCTIDGTVVTTELYP